MIVAIIDKFPVLRLGLKLFLNDQIADLTIVDSQSITSLSQDHPELRIDLIILGIGPPLSSKIGNMTLINRVKKRHPSVNFIVYDEVPEPAMVLNYLDAGIDGYLSKQADGPELIDCVREIMQGKKYVSQQVLKLVLERERFFMTRVEKKDLLTGRELEIAAYLCEGQGTNSIAARLNLKPSTVSTFKLHIFNKLKINNIIHLKAEMDKRGLLPQTTLS